MRPKNLIDDPEPLILEYNLTEWMNPDYRGNDKRQICVPALKKNYTGPVRIEHKDEVVVPPTSAQADEDELQAMCNIRKEISGEDISD